MNLENAIEKTEERINISIYLLVIFGVLILFSVFENVIKIQKNKNDKILKSLFINYSSIIKERESLKTQLNDFLNQTFQIKYENSFQKYFKKTDDLGKLTLKHDFINIATNGIFNIEITSHGEYTYRTYTEFNEYWEKLDDSFFLIKHETLLENVDNINFASLFEELNKKTDSILIFNKESKKIKLKNWLKLQNFYLSNKEAEARYKAHRDNIQEISDLNYDEKTLPKEEIEILKINSQKIEKISSELDSLDDLHSQNLTAQLIHLDNLKYREKLNERKEESVTFGIFTIQYKFLTYFYPLLFISILHWILLNLKRLKYLYNELPLNTSFYTTLFLNSKNEFSLYTLYTLIGIPFLSSISLFIYYLYFNDELSVYLETKLFFSEIKYQLSISLITALLSFIYLIRITKYLRKIKAN
ncbi:hypothetical protein EHQ16_19315 [Leptospira kanakyensis]|uniref:Uncharacterized protein n=2 Tax=Leptospira kanakyensis TaxID=2484968 RepID=A0A6N4QHG0_9LEPT|nr:hypothetical protein [Leptospira kanakyensis]TGK51133.1 hypothetical protein EHQ11_09045 [Leptospira kanakyensis]TGK56359.1 hypothetical protein EHQ16_19315 [Leptospira kanakyensis]TGK71102.1 hypothetical protein EHQ18_08325 [Leptospira kanakyensis]